MEEALVTRRLSAFVADLCYESLPRAVTEFVKLCIIDQIGVQLFLSTRPVSRIAYEYATSFGSGPCTIVCSSKRVPPELAAFANAVYGHAFELDDMHLPSLNHPGPIVVPSAFAICQNGKSGKTLIEAVACGYEVMGRIGRGLGRDYVYGRGFHPVGVIGPIGSAVAAAKAFGVSSEVLAHAIGLAVSHSGGTLEYNQTWGETTRLHAGLAAMGGIRSTVLARAGFPGPGSPIAGKYGLARVHSDEYDFGVMLADLGSVYTLLFDYFKLRPYHGAVHAVVDKVLECLATTDCGNDEDWSTAISRVDVGLNGAAMRGIAEGEDESENRNGSSTHLQFSLRVPVANAIVNGGTVDSLLNFDPNDVRVKRLAPKIHASFDEESDLAWRTDVGQYGPRMSVRVRIELNDGRVLAAFGNPFEVPRSPTQIYDKFLDLAGRVLPHSKADSLLAALQNLEATRDVNDIAPLLGP